MLRRLVLAPAVAALALGTTLTPAVAGWNQYCVEFEPGGTYDVPNVVPVLPKDVCIVLPVVGG
ncbi:MAG TPA: hypothetical protein VF519_03450 [Mycobacteriales bacterium]|jgi:hypothetical protein